MIRLSFSTEAAVTTAARVLCETIHYNDALYLFVFDHLCFMVAALIKRNKKQKQKQFERQKIIC